MEVTAGCDDPRPDLPVDRPIQRDWPVNVGTAEELVMSG